MFITVKNSKIKLVIPDGYKLVKTKNPIKNLKGGTNTSANYHKSTSNADCSFTINKINSKQAIGIDDAQGLIDMLHQHLDANSGIIKVESGTTARGYQYLYGIVKRIKPDFSGAVYQITMTLIYDDAILDLAGDFIEIGTTGQREAFSYPLVRKAKLVGNSENLFEGWAEDPYDPAYTKGKPMNLSEREALDAIFPEHPLSQARELVHAIVFDELMAPSPKQGSKEKKQQSIDETLDDDTEIIKKLFAKDAKRKFTPIKVDIEENVEQAKKFEINIPNVFQKEKATETENKQPKQNGGKNNAEKRSSVDDEITKVIADYNATYTILNDMGTRLYYQRVRSIDAIDFVENLVNSIAHQPKSFAADFGEIDSNRKSFTSAETYAKQELENAKKNAAEAGAGVVAGAAVAAMAPTAAMWVATTFGTASTGAAISALSGAAATNAALAWLGGGALAVGGGGMAAGHALLALAGPIGWGVAGASVLASVILFANNKIKTNKAKQEELISIKRNTEYLKENLEAISQLQKQTEDFRVKLVEQYNTCAAFFGADYLQLSDEQKLQLGTLVNNTKSLSVMLGKTVGQKETAV